MKLSIFFLLPLLLLSCDSQKVLIKSRSGKKRNFEIGQFNSGCCGCVALYYSLFDDTGIKTQFIFETACGIGKPTVFHFTKDSKGVIQDIKRFIAVSDSTAETIFTQLDRKLLLKLDSIVSQNETRIKVNFRFTDLVGYTTDLTERHLHPFWIDEKGKTKFGIKK